MPDRPDHGESAPGGLHAGKPRPRGAEDGHVAVIEVVAGAVECDRGRGRRAWVVGGERDLVLDVRPPEELVVEPQAVPLPLAGHVGEAVRAAVSRAADAAQHRMLVHVPAEGLVLRIVGRVLRQVMARRPAVQLIDLARAGVVARHQVADSTDLGLSKGDFMATIKAPAQGTAAAIAAVVFGAVSYALFFAVLLYCIGFMAGVLVPRSVDAGGPSAPAWSALLVNTLLFLLFAVSHSAMARPQFKAVLTRVVPAHLERSVYVLTASVALGLLFWQWRPLPDVVWDVDGVGAAALWSMYLLGWLVVVLSTFLIDHFDLFGLRQVYLFARRRDYRALGFRTPLLYRLVRHPMMLGFFLVLWSTPTMTVGHLLFAVLFSGYIVAAVQLEERDLRASLPEYAEYAECVPRFVPRPKIP